MKPLLIGLSIIMLLTFGFMIYNHLADTPGNGAVEKVEVLRVDAKHTLEKKEKEEDDDDDDKKDDKDENNEDEDEADSTNNTKKQSAIAADSVKVKKAGLGKEDSAKENP